MADAKYSPWLLAANQGDIPVQAIDGEDPTEGLSAEELATIGRFAAQRMPAMSTPQNAPADIQRKLMDFNQLAADEHERDMAMQQHQLGALEDQYSDLANKKQGINWAPLMAFADSQLGSKLSAAIPALKYESPEEKQAKLISLREKIAALQNNQSKASQAYLRNQIAALKAGMVDPNQQELLKSKIAANWAAAKTAGEKAELPQLTRGQESTDRDFARIYNDWKTEGGYAGAATQLADLDTALDRLSKNTDLTGRPSSYLPDSLGAAVNPEAIAIKDRLRRAFASSYRLTLGPQFTKEEGERVFDSNYNPRLSAKENIDKLMPMINEFKTRAREKERAAQYFEEHGTLRGFKGGSLGGSLSDRNTDDRRRLEELRRKAGQ